MQQSASFENFQARCPKFDAAAVVSSRVIFWDSILYYSSVWIKRSAIAIASGLGAALRVATKREDMTVDERLDELAAAGDALNPETGRKREVYAEFGDANFFGCLKKLYAAGLPEFNDPSFPLYHYYCW
eukprot:6745283-Prymnesium_polylepis.1